MANGLHGVLLTIKFLIERKMELGDGKVAGESRAYRDDASMKADRSHSRV